MEIPPFNKAETLDYVVLRDDFLLGELTSNEIGELGWELTDLGTGAPAVTRVAGELNHPGIISVGSGSTTPVADDGFLLHLQDLNAIVLTGGKGVYVAAVVRFPTDLTAKVFRFGLRDDSTAARPNAGVWIEFDQTVNAGVWVGGTSLGGTPTLAVSTSPVVADTFYRVEIVADDTEAQFYVDGVLVGNITTTLPTEDLGIAFSGETDAGTTEEFYQIDAFLSRINVVR
jgi:hypothetical protein